MGIGPFNAMADTLSPIGIVDSPVNGGTLSGQSIIRGWFLDGNSVSKIEIIVDGKSMGTAYYGSSRPDVANAFPKYNNYNSGYQFSLDTNQLANGSHSLLIRETSKTGVVSELNGYRFTVNNLDSIGCIDTPRNGSSVHGTSAVQGWFLDQGHVSKIEVLVDGNPVGQVSYGGSRPDVASAFPGYNNANSGFMYNLNTTNLSDGQHTLTLRETSNRGAIHLLGNESIYVNNNSYQGMIDYPYNSETLQNYTDVRGWFLDSSGVSKIEVTVDGKVQGQASYGGLRPDVAQIFPEFGNRYSGYSYRLNTVNLSNGEHTLNIKETSNNGSIKELNGYSIKVDNPKSIGIMDGPVNGETVNGTINVHGWFLDASGVSKVEVLVDGNARQADYGDPRPDVENAFPAYQNGNSGYHYAFDTTTLSDGTHTLSIKETSNDGTVSELPTRTIQIVNLPNRLMIDSPVYESMNSGTMLVNGWALDKNSVNQIKVYVDGKLDGEASYGGLRPDVYQAYPNYKNQNSGYSYSLDTSKYRDGEHTLTVEEISKDGRATRAYTNAKFLNTHYSSYLQIDLRKPANISATDIINFFQNSSHPDSPLKNYAQAYINAQNKYGVNAQYLVAHSILETGWGVSNSDLQLYKHNLYGYGAYNVCPFTCGYYYSDIEQGIDEVAYEVKTNYLSSNGVYYSTTYGPTLLGMQDSGYATDPSWSSSIASIMSQIKPLNDYYYATEAAYNPLLQAPGTFGRDIPYGAPNPTDIVISYPTPKNATVSVDQYSFRTLPYSASWTWIRSLPLGTPVTVLGYNTDVEVNGPYPYTNKWYRVLVNGEKGWIYGDGLNISN